MNQNEEKKEYGVYINSMLSKRVVLKITEIGQKLKQNCNNFVLAKILFNFFILI